MTKLSVLVFLAVWLNYSHCRRLRDAITSNEIINDNNVASDSNNNNNNNNARPKDWVRISHEPAAMINAPIGTKVEIECEIIGSPAPSVQWLRGNTPINDDDRFETNMLDEMSTRGIARVRSRLLIPAVLSIHAGVYMCVAESGSQIATATSRLVVVSDERRNFTQLIADHLLGVTESSPRVVLFYKTYMDVIGNDVVLPCKAVGNPLPSVVWLNPHEQRIDVDDDRAQILPDGALRLRNIRWSDMGPYTCVARNVVDRDQIQTFLYPMLADK